MVPSIFTIIENAQIISSFALEDEHTKIITNNNNNYSFNITKPIEPLNISKTVADFTLLIYMIGSDLEDKSYEATKDVTEMLKTNLFNPKVNVVLETGGSTGKPDKNNNRTIDFSKVQRHQIVDGNIKTISDLGKVNMGENKTLSDFLNWGVTKFPAKKYGIILWDHGGSYGGFGNDVNFANDALTMNELDYGLRLPKLSNPSSINNATSSEIEFEFIGFDSCLMASLEVARSIYNNNTITDDPSSLTNDLYKIKFKFLIASEEIEPNWGWNYTAILNTLYNNPKINFNMLGKEIINAYVNDSMRISKQKKFYADRDITLSIIDIGKIQKLEDDINSLLKKINGLQDHNSILKFLHLVEHTEHFGKTAKHSFGIVDIQNMLKNIAMKFPHLSKEANNLEGKIRSAIVKNYSGDAHLNSKGISLWFPNSQEEYENFVATKGRSTSYFVLKSIIDISRLYNPDDKMPYIFSERNGSKIELEYEDHIKNIFVDYYFKDNNNNNFIIYTQQQDLSIVDPENGKFIFEPSKVLGLCNDKSCIPITMKMQNTKDVKKIFVPVLIRSSSDNKETTASLVYSFQDNKFFFLGGINDDELIKGKSTTDNSTNSFTIGKEKISLNKGDLIYGQGLNPLKYSSIIHDIDTSNQFKNRFNNFIESKPIIVNDPRNVTLQYVDINYSAIQFILCEYSSSCGISKLYNYDTKDTFVQAQIKNNNNTNLSHFIINKTAKENSNNNNSYLYINQKHDFQLEYPANWASITKDANNKKFPNFILVPKTESIKVNSILTDSAVAKFFPVDEIKNTSSFFPKTNLVINVDDSTIQENLETKLDYFKSRDFQKLFDYDYLNYTNIDVIDGYPTFEIFAQNVDDSAYIKLIEIDNKIYTFLTFITNKDLAYLSVIKQIINSLKPNQFTSLDFSKFENKLIDELQRFSKIENLRKNYIFKNIEWRERYFDDYSFSIKYPSFLGESHNPVTDGKRIFVMLPFNDLVTTEPSLVTLEKADPMIFEYVREKAGFQNTEVLKTKKRDSDLDNNTLNLMEKLYMTLPFGRNLEKNFSFIDKNLIGIISKDYFYEDVYSTFVYGKSLAFIKDDQYMRLQMITSPDYLRTHELFFDNMIKSIKFGNSGNIK